MAILSVTPVIHETDQRWLLLELAVDGVALAERDAIVGKAFDQNVRRRHQLAQPIHQRPNAADVPHAFDGG